MDPPIYLLHDLGQLIIITQTVNHSLGYQKIHSLISIYGTFSVSQALYQVGAEPMEIPTNPYSQEAHDLVEDRHCATC